MRKIDIATLSFWQCKTMFGFYMLLENKEKTELCDRFLEFFNIKNNHAVVTVGEPTLKVTRWISKTEIITRTINQENIFPELDCVDFYKGEPEEPHQPSERRYKFVDNDKIMIMK